MNQLGSWQAGIAQNQADFQNQLAAYSQLYSGPIGLQQQQNQSDVNRGLGIAGLAQDSTNAANSYAMQNNQAQNSYNLGANQNRNQFALGRYQGQLGGYGTQTGANTQRGVGNQNFLGGLIGQGSNILQTGMGGSRAPGSGSAPGGMRGLF